MATWTAQNSRLPSLAIATEAQVMASPMTAPIKCSRAFRKFARGRCADQPASRPMLRRLVASIRCRCGENHARDIFGIARGGTKNIVAGNATRR